MFFIFNTRELFSEQKRLTSLNLKGPTLENPVLDPLAVQHLDNGLNIFMQIFSFEPKMTILKKLKLLKTRKVMKTLGFLCYVVKGQFHKRYNTAFNQGTLAVVYFHQQTGAGRSLAEIDFLTLKQLYFKHFMT